MGRENPAIWGAAQPSTFDAEHARAVDAPRLDSFLIEQRCVLTPS
jgi:hypothetical protein